MPTLGSRWITIGLVLVALSGLYSWADKVKSRWYIFNQPELHALALEAMELYPNSTAGVAHYIVSNLREKHGAAHINLDPFPHYPEPSKIRGEFPSPFKTEQEWYEAQISPYENEWLFNNAGGAMGSMYLVHASVTEYLLIFGSAVGTEGHTGRHTADDYFHILEGEQWAAKANSLVMERYPKGSMHHLKRGTVKQYKMHKGVWALELAQGWIPGMMPFGFADGFSSTLDVPTIYHTFRITGREIIRNLLHGKI